MKRTDVKLDPIGLRGCYIAGGAVLSTITNTDINDYDIYPKSNEAMMDIFATLLDSNCYVVNISDRAVTFKSNDITNHKDERILLQVMTYDTFYCPRKIFENFDFTVCMGAYDCDTQKYWFDDNFYPDIASKTLRFNPGTKYPLNSLLRIGKYVSKGYFISKPELIKIAMTVIRSGMPTSWEALETAIGGTYGREIKLAREGIEFSFEAAMTLLSEMSPNLDLYLNIGEDISNTTIDDLENMFSDHPKLLVINSEEEWFTVNPVTRQPQLKLGDVRPKNYEIELGVIFEGYKVLIEDKDGSLIPGIQTHSRTRYQIGQETEELKKPYLFVFPTYEQAKERVGMNSYKKMKIYKVTYRAVDLREVKNKEVQVTKMKVIEEVTNAPKDEPASQRGDISFLYRPL